MKRSNFLVTGSLIFAIMLLVGSALAATVSYTINGINGGGVWWDNDDLDDPVWDDKLESCGAWLMADILDDAGNIACTFSLSIGRSYHGKLVRAKGNVIEDAVQYSGYAGAYAGANWEGRGNAWVDMPGKPRAHDENPGGGVDIGGDGEPFGVSAWDAALRDGFRLERSASVGASCWQGGISAQLGIEISGF